MTKKPRVNNVARDKIRTGMILDKFQKHIEGSVKLSSTQLQAGKILLAKVLPDLKALELDGNIDNKVTTVTVNRMTHTPVDTRTRTDQDTTTIN